jgi:glutathione S-transferase
MPRCSWGLLNPSPFCAKVEVFLRMFGEPYRTEHRLLPNGTPRGKLPWIDDGGRAIPDSEDILAHLVATRGDRLGEASITPERQHACHLVRRTVEESLYFALVCERWRDQPTLQSYAEALFPKLPAPLRRMVTRIARRGMLAQLHQQGYGRHPLAAVQDKARRDLDAIASVLADRPFYTGDQPRAIDAATFGSLSNLWYIPVSTPIRQHLAGHANLVGFIERMRERYASELTAVAPR